MPHETLCRRRLARALPLVLAGLLALSSPAAGAEEDEGTSMPAPPRFLGLDRVDPFVAEATAPARLAMFEGLGPLFVRTTPVDWGRIEPHAALMAGRRLHDWEALDAFVRAWHAAGFEVVLVLDPRSSWASIPTAESDWAKVVLKSLPGAEGALLLEANEGSSRPADDRWGDWERFVIDVVERYDADGDRDAPDLTRPVRWVQVLDRPTSSQAWTGSAQEYLRLLHLASQGAAKASERVRVVHGAVDFEGLGHPPFPSDTDLQRRLAAARGGAPESSVHEARRSLAFALLSLSLRRIYGAVAHVGSAHVADEAADLAFLRHRLAADGRPDFEVWLVDSPATKLGVAGAPHPVQPSTEEARQRARWRAAASGGGKGERYVLARAWLQRGRAYDVVRTVCSALAAGATRVFLGGDDGLSSLVVATPAGDWARTPAFFALRQAAKRLQGHRRVEAKPIGRAATAYEVSYSQTNSPARLVVVVPSADRTWAGHPAEGEPEDTVTIRVPDGRYVVEELATSDAPAPRQTVFVGEGVLRVKVKAAPVYVYPDA